MTSEELVDEVAQAMMTRHLLSDLLDSDYRILAGAAVQKIRELRLTAMVSAEAEDDKW